MADALEFPRLIYRGEPDTIGTGADASGRQLDSATARCDSQDDLDVKLAAGWRLTRELDAPAAKAKK